MNEARARVCVCFLYLIFLHRFGGRSKTKNIKSREEKASDCDRHPL